MSFFRELQRRNVLRVAAAYVVAAWLIIQVVETLFPVFGLSDYAIRVVVIVLAVGLIPTLVLSWAYEITPEGFKLERDIEHRGHDTPQGGKKLDRIVMVVLALALGYFAIDKFVLDPARDAEMAEEVRADTRIEAFGDRSIAVLPFTNMSSDPEQEYFSDGISEEILNLLARMKELRVISRSTSFAYRGDINVGEVTEELNVTYVLEGSVRKAGDQVRITAQLIDGRADAHIWSNTWDRDLTDLFAVQDEVARDVAAELQVQLINRRRPTQETDPESYAMYLQARYLYYGEAWDVGDKEAPKRLLRVVLDRDPDFVPALTLLSLIHRLDRAPESKSEWVRLANMAYDLDPDDAVATLYRGMVINMSGDSATAARFLEKALALDPGNTEVLRIAAWTAYRLGRFDDAIVLGERAIAINPLCIICYPSLLLPYKISGQFEKAVTLQKKRIELIDDYGGWSNLGHVYLAMGRAEEALEVFERIADDMRVNDGGFQEFEKEYIGATATALHKLGRTAEAEERIAKLEATAPGESFFVAGYYASIGAIEKALEVTTAFLESDFEGRFSYILWHEAFVSLHDTPEWLQWRKEAGLDEETLNAIEFEIPDFGH